MVGVGSGQARQALGALIRARIPALLSAWHAALAADPKLTTGDALPHSQLDDHLPRWLEAFADLLAVPPGAQAAAAIAEDTHDAEAHGLQRWQQGYDLHEVTREWGCLHRCLVAELESLAASEPAIAAELFVEARLKLAEQISDATTASAEKYFRLERVEAAGNVRDLELALGNVRELERKHAELWQQAAHDLRGNLGVVSNVAQGLTFADLPAERRQDFLGLLRNNVSALHHLLDDVTELARLQAGQEQRRVAAFDAADLLRRLCDDVRPLADAKGLYLKVTGPQALGVEGDAVKVRRVAQNLLLNALKYTRDGGVLVSWGDTLARDDGRWFFAVEDTGPGFHAGPGAPLVDALSAATADSRRLDEAARQGSGAPAASAPELPEGDVRRVNQAQGEGLGLAIVRRLCELLDATVEVETVAERGTTIRVLVPLRYAAAHR